MSGRNIPIAMLPNLQDDAPRWCYLLKIMPVAPDVPELGITTWDEDIAYLGVPYHARRGYDSQANEATADLAVDNSEARFLVSEDYFDGITQDAIRRGNYDDARFIQYMVNPYDLSEGHVVITSGTVGRIASVDGLEGTLELRSLTQTLKQKSIIELGSNNCRVVKLGDERCKIDVDALWVTATVTAVGLETDRVLTVDGPALANNQIWPGLVKFITGANAGRSFEIEGNVGNVITLAIPTEEPIAAGDELEYRPDCTRLWSGPNSCQTYNNRANFRGEPKRPVSESEQLMAPGAGSSSAGDGTTTETLEA